jgi:hypothetical protein
LRNLPFSHPGDNPKAQVLSPPGDFFSGGGAVQLVFGADMCTGDALDAQPTGNERLAGFFRDVQKTYMSVAERAEKILGDEGDVSPDQSG